MSKPIILQLGSYPEWDQIPLDKTYDVKKLFEADDPESFLNLYTKDIKAIATRGELGANRALIEACPQLELISIYGVGFDAVDIATCKKRGIKVTNTPDVLTKDVADLGVAMMLCASRGMIGAEKWVREGSWLHQGLYPLQRRVFGKKAGILGMGRIGFEVAKRLSGFDLDIAYSDLDAKDYAKDWTFCSSAIELAHHSDFLFVTLAASGETRHIVNEEVINAVGPEGMIINISRASNIDEDALITALSLGKLGFAALDVFEGEPDLDKRFLDLPNVLLQPHHASGTIETRQAMGQLVRDNLAAHFAGKPLLTPVF